MTFRVESALISSLDPHTDLGALIHAMTSIPAVVNVIQVVLIHGGQFTEESLIIATSRETTTAPNYTRLSVPRWNRSLSPVAISLPVHSFPINGIRSNYDLSAWRISFSQISFHTRLVPPFPPFTIAVTIRSETNVFH